MTSYCFESVNVPLAEAELFWFHHNVKWLVRIDRWLRDHPVAAQFAYWVPFAVVCAHYARFIRFPDWVLLPFWVGVGFNVFRWTIWEQAIKPRIADRTDAMIADERDG